MKKRNILFLVVVMLTFVLGACGSKDPFEGKWKGTLDITKQFEDGIVEAYPELAEYVDFEELTYVIDVTFEDGMMSMAVDENSVEEFTNHFAEGMVDIEKGSLMVYLDTAELTLEEAVAESGVTEEEYIANMLSILEVDKMKDTMTEITNGALSGFEKVNGPYTFNEETIHVRYEELEYETIAYAFEGDTLVLTFQGEGFSLKIVCEKI